jgi:hypothetical protein
MYDTDQAVMSAWLGMIALISTIRARLDLFRGISKNIINSRG